jgi:hypothetical protein
MKFSDLFTFPKELPVEISHRNYIFENKDHNDYIAVTMRKEIIGNNKTFRSYTTKEIDLATRRSLLLFLANLGIRSAQPSNLTFPYFNHKPPNQR